MNKRKCFSNGIISVTVNRKFSESIRLYNQLNLTVTHLKTFLRNSGSLLCIQIRAVDNLLTEN